MTVRHVYLTYRYIYAITHALTATCRVQSVKDNLGESSLLVVSESKKGLKGLIWWLSELNALRKHMQICKTLEK